MKKKLTEEEQTLIMDCVGEVLIYKCLGLKSPCLADYERKHPRLFKRLMK